MNDQNAARLSRSGEFKLHVASITLHLPRDGRLERNILIKCQQNLAPSGGQQGGQQRRRGACCAEARALPAGSRGNGRVAGEEAAWAAAGLAGLARLRAAATVGGVCKSHIQSRRICTASLHHLVVADDALLTHSASVKQVPAFSFARSLLVEGRSHLLTQTPPSVTSSRPVVTIHCIASMNGYVGSCTQCASRTRAKAWHKSKTRLGVFGRVGLTALLGCLASGLGSADTTLNLSFRNCAIRKAGGGAQLEVEIAHTIVTASSCKKY